MNRWLISLASLLVVGSIVSAAASWWALQRTRVVPDFYSQAALRMPKDLDSAIASLEKDVVQLQGDAARLGSWCAAFTDEQVNAWLVQQLPREFPNLLPRGVTEPRIVIEDGRVFAAARYKNQHIDTIVSFEVKAALTEQANVIAIQITNLRAGALPLPLSRFLRGISAEAAKSNMEVRWDMDQSEPIALVTVPSEHRSYKHTPVIVESVGLSAGLLSLAGHTGAEAFEAYQPRGPIYQLASARVGIPSALQRNEIRQNETPSPHQVR